MARSTNKHMDRVLWMDQGTKAASRSRVRKSNLLLFVFQNMGDFATFNRIYAGYFGDIPPARETVEVARLPRDVLVEVSLICGK